MSEPCCDNHPKSCLAVGTISLLFSIGVGYTFGWRWVFLAGMVVSDVDWLIRVWKHSKP